MLTKNVSHLMTGSPARYRPRVLEIEDYISPSRASATIPALSSAVPKITRLPCILRVARFYVLKPEYPQDISFANFFLERIERRRNADSVRKGEEVKRMKLLYPSTPQS